MTLEIEEIPNQVDTVYYETQPNQSETVPVTLCPLEDEVDAVGAGGVQPHSGGRGHGGEGLGQGIGVQVICRHNTPHVNMLSIPWPNPYSTLKSQIFME